MRMATPRRDLRPTGCRPHRAVRHCCPGLGCDSLSCGGEQLPMADRTTRRLVRLAARRRNAGQPTFSGWVRLESSGWYIQIVDFLEEPSAAELLGEDAAWHFAVADWREESPAVWRCPRRRPRRPEERLLDPRAAPLIQEATHLRTLRPPPSAAG